MIFRDFFFMYLLSGLILNSAGTKKTGPSLHLRDRPVHIGICFQLFHESDHLALGDHITLL